MRRGLNIVFFGSSLVSAFWNGAATYYRGIIRELAARGHRVTFYEPDAWDRQKHRDIVDPPWAKVVVYSTNSTDAVYSALKEAAAFADVLVKTSGVGVFDELLEKVVLEYKRPGLRVIFWDVDAPATLDRCKANPADYFLPLISQYDLILTYGGGEPVIKQYETFGAKKCVPIYNGLDPITHHPVEPDSRFEGLCGFLGNRLPDREARVEKFFLNAAAAMPKEKFLLGGNGWHDKPVPPNVKCLGHVYTNEHNAFNCTPRAVLNINRDSMAAYGFSPATRVFEAAGAGACIITDAFIGLETFLEPGSEILVAESGDDVVNQLKSISPEHAREIGNAARERVLSEHTYAHRVSQLESILDTSNRSTAI